MIQKIKNILGNKRKGLSEKSHYSISQVSKDWSNFMNKDTYLTHDLKDKFNTMINYGVSEVKIPWYLFFDFSLKRKINSNIENLKRYEREVSEFNPNFVERKIKEYDPLFKQSPNPLDKNQKTAIVIDDTHNLVVAGAGSGKTEVLTTRIAYLIKRKSDSVNPKRILALAFQDKASKEIVQRLKERYDVNVEVKTFHALGKKILEDSSKNNSKKMPTILFSGDNFEIRFQKFIEKIFLSVLKEEEFQEKVFKYLEDYDEDFISKEEEDFETKEEYFKYKKSLEYTALNGIKVKSKDEKDILNFFIMNKLDNQEIKILYEEPAEWMSYLDGDGQKKIPEPDFYFPEYDLYLEHWAINEKGEVPEWFEGKNPTEEYAKNMNLKKKKFNNNDKYTLIETSHEDYLKLNFKEVLKDRFLKAIKTKSSDKKLVFVPLSYKELVSKVWDECKISVKALPKRISEFIVIAKTYNLTPKEVRLRLTNEKWSPKQRSFADIALGVYELYEKELKKENKIDFGDMINLAIKELKTNKDLYKDVYDHILIDEYQDLSHQRYRLIQVLMEKNKDCKLFCVGDDWQGIMGFSGANLDFFVNFHKYFQYPARTDLTVNYRSIKSVVDTGAELIKNNKNSQLIKKTEAKDTRIEPIEIYASNIKKEDYAYYYKEIAEHCINKIKEFHDKGYNWNDIMILCRIKNPALINFIEDFAHKESIPIDRELMRKDSIPLISVHASKGLQAKIVFVLNVNKDLYGFPCELENPDIFESVRLGEKKDREEEERRLFYVAITRAKEKVIIYTQKCSSSKFLNEIKGHTKWINLH
ncbi:MAG: UvrD-helicase domain-containing protein [Nanoarchaeota archaeon]|nr:UvrD-helicase domain-containing protein [Nanoarchaeota archaeon]